jgi:hypothetical protein
MRGYRRWRTTTCWWPTSYISANFWPLSQQGRRNFPGGHRQCKVEIKIDVPTNDSIGEGKDNKYKPFLSQDQTSQDLVQGQESASGTQTRMGLWDGTVEYEAYVTNVHTLIATGPNFYKY